jgi:hypothetical protein
MEVAHEPLLWDSAVTGCGQACKFCLTKLLNMAMVRNVELILGQTLNEFYNFVVSYLYTLFNVLLLNLITTL